MINYKLLESLAEKIPSASLLLNSNGYHHGITIANRQQVYSVHASFHREIFFDFCKNNQITLSNTLVEMLKKRRRFLVDLDSLSTDIYRIYFFKENFTDQIEYQEFSRYPIERLPLEQCLALAANHIDYYKKINETEFNTRIAVADTIIPVAVMKDDLGRYTLLDGVHRICRLHQQGATQVVAYVLPIKSNLNLVENIVPNSELDFQDAKVNLAFQKLKSLLPQQDCDLFVMKNFFGLGIYFNALRDKSVMYKFYFYNNSQTITQYKIDKNHIYQGQYQEVLVKNDSYFNDSLGIKSLMQNQKTTSFKRLDIDQSYLTVDFRE